MQYKMTPERHKEDCVMLAKTAISEEIAEASMAAQGRVEDLIRNLWSMVVEKEIKKAEKRAVEAEERERVELAAIREIEAALDKWSVRGDMHAAGMFVLIQAIRDAVDKVMWGVGPGTNGAGSNGEDDGLG